MKLTIQEEIELFKNKLRSIKTVRDFFETIPASSIVRIAFWLLSALAASPLYILLRSIFLDYHDSFYLNDNQRTLGTYWVQFIKIIGYSGLLLTFLFLLKYLAEHHQKRWLTKALKRHPVPVFLFLMLVWSVFSFMFSSNHTLSLYGSNYRCEGLLTYFAYTGIFCCGYMILDKKLRLSIMRIFVLTAAVLSILMLINHPELNLLLSMEPYAAIFQNINHYGYYLCLAASLAAALVIREAKMNKAALFWCLIYAILITTLIKNKSFGPYVAVVLGLIFLLTLSFIHVKKAKLCTVILVLVFIALSLGLNLKTKYLTRETTQLGKDIVNILENNDQAPQAGSNRWILWTLGIKYTLEKPVFGYGPDNLSSRYQLDNLNHDRPHNEILQLSASLGIPAALFYCCALFCYFFPLLKKLKKLSPEIMGLYAAVITYLASSMVGLSMYCTTSFFFAFLGLTCNLFRADGNEPESTNVISE